jgi:hypothetical protein
LASKLPDAARCLVLDIRRPGMGGLDFQAELADAEQKGVPRMPTYTKKPEARSGGYKCQFSSRFSRRPTAARR